MGRHSLTAGGKRSNGEGLKVYSPDSMAPGAGGHPLRMCAVRSIHTRFCRRRRSSRMGREAQVRKAQEIRRAQRENSLSATSIEVFFVSDRSTLTDAQKPAAWGGRGARTWHPPVIECRRRNRPRGSQSERLPAHRLSNGVLHPLAASIGSEPSPTIDTLSSENILRAARRCDQEGR